MMARMSADRTRSQLRKLNPGPATDRPTAREVMGTFCPEQRRYGEPPPRSEAPEPAVGGAPVRPRRWARPARWGWSARVDGGSRHDGHRSDTSALPAAPAPPYLGQLVARAGRV